ncbi:serine--tRNA ligase [Govanella unica]|uniref:Serine--tRNA ligase n=1 Tax=Govanella unica TaxID=2975056 RepID=A0A9X3Z6S6_9PROT|nr:serine--tRNA ligase [Govania unica]MDA5193323.1 serine--tRNA ligase [Govania unica]
MIDIKALRDNPQVFDQGWERRGLAPMSAGLLAIDEKRRALQTEIQGLLARRNDASRQIGELKKKGENADAVMAEVATLKARLPELEEAERTLATELEDQLARLPNIPADETPDGADESGNVETRRFGTPREFDFTPREHFDLGEALGQMHFDRAAKLSGSRFVVLSGALARLERALGAFMIDLHTDSHGYREMATPILVRDEAMFGTGQLPKFADDFFRTTNGFSLIPTAEVTLTNQHMDEILDEDKLPLRYAALTPCFRSEAGAAGKDTRGMIRQHQFMKVEIVSLTTPEQAAAEHERLTGCAEEVLKRLELPYRVLELCTGDIGFSACRTFDLEVWLPGQGVYREISSCSHFGDFQARRMKTRYRPAGAKDTRFIHTLNGSGLAVGRTLVAVLENYQQADGSIRVPEVLRPYMNGLEVISKDV